MAMRSMVVRGWHTEAVKVHSMCSIGQHIAHRKDTRCLADCCASTMPAVCQKCLGATAHVFQRLSIRLFGYLMLGRRARLLQLSVPLNSPDSETCEGQAELSCTSTSARLGWPATSLFLPQCPDATSRSLMQKPDTEAWHQCN